MRPGQRFLAPVVLLTALLPSCGAQDAPGPKPLPQPQRCQSLQALAPALMDSLEGTNAERLRTIIERERLFDEGPDGSPSPIVTLLRVALGTLRSMASDPAEPGAAPGQLCNEERPPPSKDSNRMCEARRILEIFVHEGQGVEVVQLLDPFIAQIIAFIAGDGVHAPRLEVSQVLSTSCSKAFCRTEDVLDVGIGLLAFLEPTAEDPDRPVRLLGLLHELLADPAMDAVLGSAEQHMREEGYVVFGNLLLDNLGALPSTPEAFASRYHRDIEVKINDLLTTTLGIRREDPRYASLRRLVDQIVGPHELADLDRPHGNPSPKPLLMDALDPSRQPGILVPLQQVVACFRKVDTGNAVLKMLYGLMYAGGEESIDLADILGAFEGLSSIDDRASILTFLKRTFAMLREDEEGLGAARKICAVGLSTARPAKGGPSNSELFLPVGVELFGGGGLSEGVCVVDSLLYGCASGPQPACTPLLRP